MAGVTGKKYNYIDVHKPDETPTQASGHIYPKTAGAKFDFFKNLFSILLNFIFARMDYSTHKLFYVYVYIFLSMVCTLRDQRR